MATNTPPTHDPTSHGTGIQLPATRATQKDKEKKKKKMLYTKNQKLTMLCEWNGCDTEFDEEDSFHKHLDDHVAAVMSNNGNPVPDECYWTNCGYTQQQTEDGAAEMLRHIFFHVYHTRLKALGTVVQAANDWQECRLDDATKNVIPELPDSLVCGWEYCDVIHNSVNFFYKHVSFHADNEDEPKCMWNGCGQKLASRSKLKVHLRSHTQEKVIACPTCGALFADRAKLSDHLARQQGESEDSTSNLVFECSHCFRSLPSKRLFRDHMRTHVNNYRCSHCDMTCVTPSALKSHIRYRHTSSTPYQCTECPYAGKKVVDLRKHLETHVPSDFFKCQVENCTFSCKTYQVLTKHYVRNHECDTTYECHLCKAQFDRSEGITAHLQNEHHFKWPSGHKRFRYRVHPDGVRRLQMVRYENVQLSVVPDEKMIQALSKDGIEVGQIETNPPRKPYKTPKPRARKRKAKADAVDTSGPKMPKKSDADNVVLEAEQLPVEQYQRTVARESLATQNHSSSSQKSAPVIAMVYADGDTVSSIPNQLMSAQQKSESRRLPSAGVAGSADQCYLTVSLDQQSVEKPVVWPNHQPPVVTVFAAARAAAVQNSAMDNNIVVTSSSAKVPVPVPLLSTAESTVVSGMYNSVGLSDVPMRKIGNADEENLEMLGEVALGFSGLFPKSTDVSPVKFWSSSTKGFESPLKSEAPVSDTLQTYPEKLEHSSVSSRKSMFFKENAEKRKSPRKGSKPKRFSSYADHVTPKRNVLSLDA